MELLLTQRPLPEATLIAHRQGGGALILHGDHQVVEALALTVRWGRTCGDLATETVHAEGHVLIAFSDVVGQDTVDPDVLVSGSHLDHSGTPTHVLGGEQERSYFGLKASGAKSSTCS